MAATAFIRDFKDEFTGVIDAPLDIVVITGEGETVRDEKAL